jgi:hypothetical protein
MAQNVGKLIVAALARPAEKKGDDCTTTSRHAMITARRKNNATVEVSGEAQQRSNLRAKKLPK